MFEDEKVLEWCIENEISVTQYLFLFFLIERAFDKPFAQSYAKRYVKSIGMIDSEDVKSLIERGFIEDWNTVGEARPELYVIKDDVVKLIKATDDKAEELWTSYPATFEIKNDIKFNARVAGVLIDKENTKATYLKKIGRSKKKHAFVMEMLTKYLRLVDAKKMNSMKLGDWIANEMWDAVNEVNEEDSYGIEVR